MNQENGYSEEPEEFICAECEDEIKDKLFSIQWINFTTENLDYYVISTQYMVDIINIWSEKNIIHLSATEILLFRVDLILDILKEHYEQAILFWGFITAINCEKCYNKHIEKYPLR